MKINVGCGQFPTAGWKNFDNSLTIRLAKIPGISHALSARHPDPDYRRFLDLCRSGAVEYAAAQRMPIKTGTADVVYSAHMLEHLYPREARDFLTEAKRVLRPGGIIRLAMPDLEMLVRAYLQHGDANLLVEKSLLAVPECLGLSNKLRFLIAGNRHHHAWMYDGRSLCRLLTQCNFSDAVVLPAGSTRIPDPEPLDLNERADQSVYVEAIA